MRFEIAVALNWKKYLDQLTTNKSTYKLLSTFTACRIRETFTRYINNVSAPLKKDLMPLYYVLKTQKDLPYPVSEPDVVLNNQAVQCGQKLMLFHWFDKISDKDEWKVKSKNLQNYRKVSYEFKDKKKVTFEMCDLTYDNLSYLKVINWTVYASFKRIQELPEIKKNKLDNRLFPYQVEGVRMLSAGFRLLADEQGLGKALTLDTRIPTPTGWTTMGALKVGDRVFDDMGNATTVTHTYYHKDKNVYRVTFSDGVSIDCCEDHLWQIHDQHGLKVVPLKWFLQKDQFGTIRKDKLKDKYIWKYYIPKCAPVQYDAQEIPFDAYVLGALLGDGCLTRPSVLFTTADEEMFDNINKRLFAGYSLKKRKYNTYDYYITAGTFGHNAYKEALHNLHLCGCKSNDKFVPECYKYNTKQIRLDVLRGLLDTDGYATKDGVVEFCSISKRLADDVRFLAESLGYLCSFSTKTPRCNGKECSTAYVVRIKSETPAELFLLERKRNKLPLVRHFKPRRNIVSIEYIGVQDVKCITVNSPSHLYLCDHFVVTHNTAQVLQFIKLKGLKKILICCPATLKLNWRKEALMWTDFTKEDISIIQGSQPYDVNNKITIINYDLLPYWAETLKRNKYQLVVADECHYIQSDKAQRTKAFLTVIENSEDRIFISGTPFTSRPYQMYTALHNIAPKVFHSAQEYGLKFCGPVYQRNQLVFKGASNMDVLHSILMDGICIRRLKEDVLEELPEKMRITVPMGMDAAEIRKDPDLFREICYLEGKIARSKDPLGTMEWRKQIAYLRKQRDIIAWIKDFMETGKKLVVFGVHKIALDAIEQAFPEFSVRVDGSTPNKTRDVYVERFQSDPDCRLFIGNVQAAGVGITLTAASDLLMVEFPWTFSAVAQAEDRIHRIGAKNACTIYYMTCPDTIDEKLVEIINTKAKIHTKIFDGKNEDNLIAGLKDFKYVPLFPEENKIDLKESEESGNENV